jgi:hypothetical protein
MNTDYVTPMQRNTFEFNDSYDHHCVKITPSIGKIVISGHQCDMTITLVEVVQQSLIFFNTLVRQHRAYLKNRTLMLMHFITYSLIPWRDELGAPVIQQNKLIKSLYINYEHS